MDTDAVDVSIALGRCYDVLCYLGSLALVWLEVLIDKDRVNYRMALLDDVLPRPTWSTGLETESVEGVSVTIGSLRQRMEGIWMALTA